ncbi:MAG: protein kinase domain-containing protein [Actinomycetota bacterium]
MTGGTSSRRDLLIGTELAGHRIESLIGRGGMGSVYLAEQIGLGRKVALKVLAPELAASENFRLRFERESRLAASLDHPHVIPIFQSGEADGLLFIAMRYVDGTDLATLLATEGALPLGEAAVLVSQVASALDAAHARGLVHRDVKPGNVLIARGEPDEERYAYLSDFGLTRMTSSDSALTRTGQFMGTVAYAAPEQFEGRTADAMTDLYSLGCVAYECLTGERPFPREQEAAVMFAHLQQAPPAVTERRPDAPAVLDEVLAKALAKAPEERFASGRALGAALRSAVGAVTGPSLFAGATSPPAPAGAAATPSVAPPTMPPSAGDGAPVTTGTRARGPDVTPLSSQGPGTVRRRRAVLGALVVGVVVAAAVAAVLLARGSGHPSARTSGGPSAPSSGAAVPGAPPGVPIKVDTVAKLDARSGRVLADYPVGTNPQDITFSGDSVWVINSDDVTISKIDSATGHVSTRGGIPSPCALSPGPGGGVWVDVCDQNEIVLVDPNSFEVDRTLHVPGPGHVVSAYGSVWAVSNRGSAAKSFLYRFTPSGRLLTRIGLGLDSSIVVSADGALWGNDFGDGTIWRVDPGTDDVQFIEGWTGPYDIAASDQGLWIGDGQTRPPTVTQWDPVARQAVGLIRGYSGAIAVTADAVWVQDSGPDSLVKVDPQTDQILAQFQLGFSSDMALGNGSLWISAGSD